MKTNSFTFCIHSVGEWIMNELGGDPQQSGPSAPDYSFLEKPAKLLNCAAESGRVLPPSRVQPVCRKQPL
ncbi:hypothetical protein EYF80_020595 [Liparis tanakae]|uniref:Uncharacterized protein n=1 Tax=Liparis tanakae TaxID=230148 RepID=A0A4Z2HTP8_9TELE|nr:hypothetical protein EYF80_020595 [Liparis tanakae]